MCEGKKYRSFTPQKKKDHLILAKSIATKSDFACQILVKNCRVLLKI